LKKIDHRVHCETIASIAVKEKLPPAKPQKKPKTRKEKTSRPLRNLRAHCGKIKPQEGMFLSRKVTKPPKKKVCKISNLPNIPTSQLPYILTK
jgi:hypothetical protein